MVGVRRVAITGVGVCTPLGCGVPDFWTNLINGFCGISKTHVDISSDWKSISRASALGVIATHEAFRQVKWKMNSAYRAGVYFGVGMDGPSEVIDTASGILTKKYSGVGPHALTRTLSNIPAGVISRIWGLRGPCMATNTACAAGLHCIGEAFRMSYIVEVTKVSFQGAYNIHMIAFLQGYWGIGVYRAFYCEISRIIEESMHAYLVS
ncbi:unnamed protein product [Trichobilharzia regenti]|nr:unnamed protein product [Trichobilharzia regenti]